MFEPFFEVSAPFRAPKKEKKTEKKTEKKMKKSWKKNEKKNYKKIGSFQIFFIFLSVQEFRHLSICVLFSRVTERHDQKILADRIT